MSNQINELTFLKYLAPRFSINVPAFLEWPVHRQTLHEFVEKYPTTIAKPDILAGKRGKEGAIIKVESTPEAMNALGKLATYQSNGNSARTSYILEFIPSKMEIYTAITYDSKTLCPVITVSLKGGMDIESVGEKDKKTFPISNIFRGVDAYQAGKMLKDLNCPNDLISPMARSIVNLWDMFISTGMKMCEINPWRVTPANKPIACDFKGIFDGNNFKQKNLGFEWPEYPMMISEFEEEMEEWSKQSYQGQAHVSDLGGKGILPILFGGGASTIIIETLFKYNGDPMFLSDFGGNPPYERMKRTAEICFKHNLKTTGLLLILGGKANNTRIDITFQSIADALREHAYLRNGKKLPVIIGRGGPQLVTGLLSMRDALEELEWPYVIFGHDTPITMVAQYAADLYNYLAENRMEA